MAFTKAGLWGPDAVIDSTGHPQPGAAAAVYLSDGVTLAGLWTTSAKNAAGPNPTHADVHGNLYFYADPGSYVLKVTIGGTVTALTVEVPIDPGEAAQDQDVVAAIATAEAYADGIVAAGLATKQPLDSDLTAIATLATTAFGRSFLALADAAAGQTLLSLGTAATQPSTAFDAAGAAAAAQAASQPLDSDLTAIAALATTAFGRSVLTRVDAAALRVLAGTVIGTDVQAHDPDLDTIAALDSSTAGALSTDGAGWLRKTYAQLKTALGLVKADVGLGSVDNTSDINKPVSTAQQTLLDLKVATSGPTADLPFNSHKATGLADPTSAQDAATKAYVDAVAQGFSVKAAVRAASNTNHALSAPGATVDSVAMTSGDRVLLRAQAAPAENGIWVWNGAAVAMTRATDADTSPEVTSGLYTFVTEGSTWASTGFALITPDPIVLGTTALTFTPVSGAGQIVAGTALTKTGSTIALSDVELLALAGLTSAADSLPYFTGAGTAALTTLSSFVRTLLDDADAATARTTLGLDTAATHPATDFAPSSGIAESAVTSLVSDLAAKAPLANLPIHASAYSVVADGVTNDREALRSAIAAAVAQSRKLQLPEGTILVTFATPGDALAVTGNVHILGMGKNRTTIKFGPDNNTFTYDGFSITTGSKVTLEDMTIAGPTGGHREVFDATVSAGANAVVTSATANWTADDVGRAIEVGASNVSSGTITALGPGPNDVTTNKVGTAGSGLTASIMNVNVRGIVSGGTGTGETRLRNVNITGGWRLAIDNGGSGNSLLDLDDVYLESVMSTIQTGGDTSVTTYKQARLNRVDFAGPSTGSVSGLHHCLYIGPGVALAATKCRFRSTPFTGLAIHCFGSGVNVPAYWNVTDCVFDSGVYSAMYTSECTTGLVSGCTFNGLQGGVISVRADSTKTLTIGGAAPTAQPSLGAEINNCRFIACAGSGVSTSTATRAHEINVKGCRFIDMVGVNVGVSTNGTWRVSECFFEQNYITSAPIAHNTSGTGKLFVNNCHFIANATAVSGGIRWRHNRLRVRNCVFEGDFSGGGAIWVDAAGTTPDADISGCDFRHTGGNAVLFASGLTSGTVKGRDNRFDTKYPVPTVGTYHTFDIRKGLAPTAVASGATMTLPWTDFDTFHISGSTTVSKLHVGSTTSTIAFNGRVTLIADSGFTLANAVAGAGQIVTGTGADLVLAAGMAVTLQFDPTAATPQWFVVSQPHAAVLDTIASALAGKVDASGPTADLPFNSHKATGLADPTAAQDAATKAYVDSVSGAGTSDPELLALAGLTSAANKLPYFTGSGAAALADLSAFARTLLDDADAATMLSTLSAAHRVQVDVYATSGSFTWSKPTWATAVQVYVQSAGGGGGSGRKGAAGTVRCGGGGASPGALSFAEILASDLGPTVGVTVGVGGAVGASQTVNSTSGSAGSAGGTSYFGDAANSAHVRSGGGQPGGGGTATTGAAGAASAGMVEGTGTAASTTGGAGVNGGGSSIGNAGSGGSGGGITTGDAASAGGAGGAPGSRALITGPAGGAIGTTGASGGVLDANGTAGGTAGAGGGSSTTGDAGAGGNGARGAGGGGGGASVDSVGNSGAGGIGGDGFVIVISRG